MVRQVTVVSFGSFKSCFSFSSTVLPPKHRPRTSGPNRRTSSLHAVHLHSWKTFFRVDLLLPSLLSTKLTWSSFSRALRDHSACLDVCQKSDPSAFRGPRTVRWPPNKALGVCTSNNLSIAYLSYVADLWVLRVNEINKQGSPKHIMYQLFFPSLILQDYDHFGTNVKGRGTLRPTPATPPNTTSSNHR